MPGSALHGPVMQQPTQAQDEVCGPNACQAIIIAPCATEGIPAIDGHDRELGERLERFVSSMQCPNAPILPPPPPRRRRNAVPLDFTPRRSGRIAKADRGLDSEK